MCKRRTRLNIMQKLVFTYSLIFIVIVAIINHVLIAKYEKDEMTKLHAKEVNHIEEEIAVMERNAIIMERTAQLVVGNNNLRDYLSRIDKVSLEEVMDFKFSTYNDIHQIGYNNPEVKSISIYFDNDEGVELIPILKKKHRMEGKIYKQVIATKYLRVYYVDENIYLYRTILGYEGDRPFGVVEVVMEKETFFPKMFSQEKEKQQMVIVNNRVMTDWKNPLHQQSRVLSRDLVDKIKDTATNEVNSFHHKEGNHEFLIVTKKSDYLDWVVVNMIDLANLNKELKIRKFTGFLITNLLIGFVIVFITFATKKLLKDLYTITDSMKAVQEGEMPVKINIQSQDEFGSLAKGYQYMLEKIETLIEDVTKKRLAAHDAQLKALQNQIDAHFIFNVLENIKMMAEIEEQYVISDSTTALGHMMRYNMNWKRDFITLEEELFQVKNYVYLMNLRHDNQIQLRIEGAEGYEDIPVLKMSLQPIIENAILHGGKGRLPNQVLEISISIEKVEDEMKIVVSDNGDGMPIEQLKRVREHIYSIQNESGKSIGLQNINERFHLFYGDKSSFLIDSMEGKGTVCTLLLPIKK